MKTGLARELEDTNVNLSIDGWAPSRVIRSHRAPASQTPKRVGRMVLVFAVAVGSISLSEVRIEDSRHEPVATVAAAPVDELAHVPTDLERESVAITPPVSRSTNRNEIPAKIIPSPGSTIEVVIEFALAQRGDRYVWATSGPNTYDCSGLVLRAFKQIGISLPHFTGTMMNRGFKVDRANLKRGDIVFPTSGHVGIYLGNNQFVHASSGQGKVVTGKLYSFYTARRIA